MMRQYRCFGAFLVLVNATRWASGYHEVVLEPGWIVEVLPPFAGG